MSSVYSKKKPGIDLRAEYQKFIGKKMLFLISLIFGIVLLAGYAATRGSADISVVDVYTTIIARFLPGHLRPPGSRTQSSGVCVCIAFFWLLWVA